MDELFTFAEACELWGEAHLRTLLRSGHVRHLLHGVYADAHADDPWLLHRAALLAAPAGSALGDASAAALLGRGLDPPSVPYLVTPAASQLRGVHTRVAPLPAAELAQRLGMTVTSGDRTAADCGRYLSRFPAVIAIDSVLNSGAATLAGAAAVLAGYAGDRGVARARDRLAEGEPGSGSSEETRLRLVLVDAGFPRPQAQVVVRDELGGFLARVDLGWPLASYGLEYVGAVHLEPAQAARDRARRRALADGSGWEIDEVGVEEMRRQSVLTHRVGVVLTRRWPGLLAG